MLLQLADEGKEPIPSWAATCEAAGLDRAAQARIQSGWTSFLRRFGFEVRSVETTCVNDEFTTVGKVDRVIIATRAIIYRDGSGWSIEAGTVLIADIKTGRFLNGGKQSGSKLAVANSQLAAYAGAVPYDPRVGARSEWKTGPPSQEPANQLPHRI